MKQLDMKELRLSKEPLLSDEVITIVVRMPDGGRCERRFLKTDKLEVKFQNWQTGGKISFRIWWKPNSEDISAEVANATLKQK